MNFVRVIESLEDAARTLADVRSLGNDITGKDLDSLATTISGLEAQLQDIKKEIYADDMDLDIRLELAYAQRDMLEANATSAVATAQPRSVRSRGKASTIRSPQRTEDVIPAIHANAQSTGGQSDRSALGLVTEEEFATVSSYMRGRLTLEKVNKAVMELTRHAESNRELVIAARRGTSGKNIDRKHASWLNSNVVPVIRSGGSKFFVVDTDLKRGNHLLPGSNSSRAILTILRHLGRVAETRLTADGKSHIVYSLLYIRS